MPSNIAGLDGIHAVISGIDAVLHDNHEGLSDTGAVRCGIDAVLMTIDGVSNLEAAALAETVAAGSGDAARRSRRGEAST